MTDTPGADDDGKADARALGAAVQRLRTHQGMARKELAGEVEISSDYLSKIERGERSPSDEVFASLAASLGVEGDEIRRYADQVATEATGGHPPPASDASSATDGGLPPTSRSMPTGRGRPPRPSRRPTGPRGRRDDWPPQWSDPRAQAVAASAEVVAQADGEALLDLVEWMLSTLRTLDRTQIAELRHLIEARAGKSAFSPDHAGHAERALELIGAWLDTAGEELDDQQLEQLLAFALHLVREDLHPTSPKSPRVSTAEPDRSHYTWLQAIGLDDDGHLWINPQASARTFGNTAKDPRIWRFDDGRVVVDLSQLSHDATPSPRDPELHRVRALVHQRVEGLPAEAYNNTEIAIDWPTGHIVVEPAPYGQTHGTFPHDATRIHVITAANPHSRLLPPDENRRRNEVLRAQLDAQGQRCHHALIRSRDAPERRWEEPAFAVIDADRDAMVALARGHGQFALFEWTPTERALVRCQQPDHPEDAVVEPLGWQTRWEEPSTETATLPPAE